MVRSGTVIVARAGSGVQVSVLVPSTPELKSSKILQAGLCADFRVGSN